MQLLLASKSPRRRQLLAELGIPMRVVDVEVDEILDHAVPASEAAEALACLKAQGYRQPLDPDQVLVAADTVVVHDNQVLGKPHTPEEARHMLHSLSGDTHMVYTGVCLRTRNATRHFTEATLVQFAALTRQEIDHYVDTCRPYDKAGAYGIQEWIGLVGISRIEGCYYNVMGLPTSRLYHELQCLTL